MPPEPLETPSLAVVLCVERGPLEAQAVLLCESLRAFGGRFRDAPVYALAPRPGRRPAPATVQALEALEVDYIDQALETGCPEYGSANRVAAAAHVERIASCELLAVVDTDTYFTAEPAAFHLPSDVTATVQPVDVKGMATSGPDDLCDGYWRQLCACCGVPYDSLPLVTTTDGEATVKACYNGGLVVVRAGQGILGRWSEFFLASVRRDLRPWHGAVAKTIRSSTGVVPDAAARWWGSNQAALALALWSSTTQIEPLPAGYNYPLHMDAHLPSEYRSRARRQLVHVHYHYLLDADALPRNPLLAADSPLSVEQLAWLRARVPLAPPESAARPHRRGPLVVTGMHRSATSLVASALQRAGLNVGEDQGTGIGNPRGHFEDRDFHRLHEDLLAAAGHDCFTAEGELLPPPGSVLEQRARALVAERSTLPLWGWKDPRTCLFLDLWQPLLPQAVFLFLYRHPLDVALSLWRRNTDDVLRRDPLQAIRAWEVYNQRLLAFCERHRERCLLVQVPTVTRDLDQLVQLLVARFDLPLQAEGLSALFEEAALAPRLGLLDAIGERWFPDALALYRRLQESADLPGPPASELSESASAETSVAQQELTLVLESLLVPLLERRRREAVEGELLRQRDELAAALAAEREAVTELRRGHDAAVAELRRGHDSAVAELRREHATAAAELRREHDAAAEEAALTSARCDEIATTLASIEGARSFAPVRAWWRLRTWLDRRQA